MHIGTPDARAEAEALLGARLEEQEAVLHQRVDVGRIELERARARLERGIGKDLVGLHRRRRHDGGQIHFTVGAVGCEVRIQRPHRPVVDRDGHVGVGGDEAVPWEMLADTSHVGAAQAGDEWVALVLGASSLLNAAYFLPILYRAYFRPPPADWPAERKFGPWETHWMLLLPMLATAALVLYAGLLAESPFSPLAWAKFITRREYEP